MNALTRAQATLCRKGTSMQYSERSLSVKVEAESSVKGKVAAKQRWGELFGSSDSDNPD